MEFKCKEEHITEESPTIPSSLAAKTVCENKNSSGPLPQVEIDPPDSCEINQCTTSVGEIDKSIPISLEIVRSEQVHAKRKQSSISTLTLPSTNNPVSVKTDAKCESELVSEELVPQTEFVQCKEEWIAEDLVPEMEFVECEEEWINEEHVLDSESASSEPTPGVTDIKLKSPEVLECGEDSEHPRRSSSEEKEGFVGMSVTVEGHGIELPQRHTAQNPPSPHHSSLPMGGASDPNLISETLTKYECEVCNKTFFEPKKLVTHMRTHKSERPFSCSFCRKTFTHKSALKTHVRIHTGERPYVCDICEKGFQQCSVLKAHRRIHTGERPFNCNICGKSFRDSSTVTKHLLVHSGERPYSCEICGKTFRQSHVLTTHVRIHTGERPFSCKVCGKTFRDSSSMTKHLLIHSGERPYGCEICGKTFRLSHVLKSHLRIHTERC